MNRFFTWEKIKHFLNISSIVMAIALAPLSLLILLSQNSVPGDLLYPYKRGLENMILAGASVSPVTRVAFRTDLADRRFDEAETLLVNDQDIEGLREFVKEVKTTHAELSAIQNQTDKENLQKKFTDSMSAYRQKLQIVQSKLDAKGESSPVALVSSGNQPASQPQPTPTVVVPTNTPVPQPTARPGQPRRPTNTPVPLPTATPTTIIPIPTNTPIPRPTSLPGLPPEPTNTPVPLPTATPRPPTPTPTQSGPAPAPVCGVQEILLSTPSIDAFVTCMGQLCPGEPESDCDSLNPIRSKSQGNNSHEFLDQPTITPQPTPIEDESESSSSKENNKREKVKGASDTKVDDPFVELFNWLLPPGFLRG